MDQNLISIQPNALARLNSFPIETFKKGSFIARQDEPVTYIFFLIKGSCIRNYFSPKGDEIKYDERSANNTVQCLIGGLSHYSPVIIHQTNFIAKTDCECRKIFYQDYLQILQEYPSMVHSLLYMAMNAYIRLDANFHAKQKGQASSRVCEFIQKNSFPTKEGPLLSKKITISEMSRLLGMHRVTVNKIVLALCDNGVLLRTENGFIIKDIERIQSYAGNSEQLDYLNK